ncbi:uncharacterized protein LOC131998398 [Stomoxys calcitrans]|uniref:uncharacterized protein LOC131998398 n=1 Tax=Stomoxys calcitrans TaxID=35570 RepID=UPI0027E287A3|nr:uncharacterized protein LOC131998398 [Stomoxys calcitrans]
MFVAKRRDVIREKGFCYNCLGTAHTRNWCPSRSKCMVCQLNHHTMVHVDKSPNPKAASQPRESSNTHEYHRSRTSSHKPSSSRTKKQSNNRQRSSPQNKRTSNHKPHFKERLSRRSRVHVFLPTALARVRTSEGPAKARLLLSSGEVQTVILQALVDRLNLQTIKRDSKTYCTLNLESYHDPMVKIQVTGLVHSRFHTTLPTTTTAAKLRTIYDTLHDLADPHFCNPSNVEILLANDNLPKILRAGMIQTSSNMPIAQSTIFGWIISGACHY